MKNLFILLFIVVTTYTTTAQSKEENLIKQQIEELTEVLQLTETEKSNIYDILLERELKVSAIKTGYKSDPEARSAEMKKINPVYNRKIKDIIGKERMAIYNEYKKEQRKKK